MSKEQLPKSSSGENIDPKVIHLQDAERIENFQGHKKSLEKFIKDKFGFVINLPGGEKEIIDVEVVPEEPKQLPLEKKDKDE